jgi:hypothetical protein
MKRNIALLNRAGRWFGTGYWMKPNSPFGWLVGNLPGFLLWLAVLPLAALGQANYSTPYTSIIIAGAQGLAGSADGTNGAARFYGPVGVAVDTNGSLYVPEVGNNTIRIVKPVGTNWVVTTLAGLAGFIAEIDGTGSAARFNSQIGLAVDKAGNIYVADTGNSTIRKGFPASSVPPPMLQSPSLSVGEFGFGITGLSGLAVNIESSTNLSSWKVTGSSILVGGANYYSVSPNPAQGAQFYRARVR